MSKIARIVTVLVILYALVPGSTLVGLLAQSEPEVAQVQPSEQRSVWNCKGVFTNQPCALGTPIFQEMQSESAADQSGLSVVDSSDGTGLSSQAARLVNALESEVFNLERELNVNISTDLVREVCQQQSLESCQQAVLNKESELARLREAALQQRTLNDQSTDAESASKNTSVVISGDFSQNYYGGVRPRPTRFPRPTGEPGGGHPEVQIPGAEFSDYPFQDVPRLRMNRR